MVGNLPEETSSFVGRGPELARLHGALLQHRLVTLTGSGGIGKSRLALRAAGQARPSYRDGAAWADLSPLYDERLLLLTVSDAVGLSDQTLRSPVDALRARLGDQHLLLVLDCCERVAASCARLVGELLAEAPGLTVLATSRQPLGVPGEFCVEVQPLPLDGDQEAVQLFRDRAARTAPHIRLDTPAAAAAVATICRRLEGIPLAVELACARLDTDSVEEIADRLTTRGGYRLDALTDRNVWPQRHRALRTAVGWSHELCAPLERLLWARLSVFRGAVDAQDARAVCAGGPLTPEAVAAGLAGLVGQSVLSWDGARYRMLDTIREYGAMWLTELGEEQLLAERHARHFADLVREAHTGWLGPDQVAWYGRIADAHADLCAALDHLLVRDPAAAVEMAGRAGLFWSCCGHLHEARIYLERALEGPHDRGPDHTRALWALSVTTALQGDYAVALEVGERCGISAWHDQDPESRLSAAFALGLTHLMTGRPRAAHTVCDRALRSLPGDPVDAPSRLRCRVIRIFALSAMGRLDEARVQAAELQGIAVRYGERWSRAYADHQLALIHLLQGRPAEAEEHARAMLLGKYELRDSLGIALGLDLFAAAMAAQGDGIGAAHAYGTGQAYWRMIGYPQGGTPELAAMRAEWENQARAAAGSPAYDSAFSRGLVGDGAGGLARVLEGRLPTDT